MVRLMGVVVVLVGLAGCELETSCDRLADYVCTCRADDTGYDCDEYLALAVDPDADVLDQCVVELEELRTEDDAAGDVCPVA